MSELNLPGPRRWYRSLYWRIAIGFIAFLAAMLVAQGGLFLWLSTQREEALPPRLVVDLAALVAEELGDAAERGSDVDLARLADERFRDLARPAALVLADGRVVAGDVLPPPPLLDEVRAQLAAGDQAWPARRLPNTRRRELRQQGRDGDGRGAGGRQGLRPPGPPWAVAPVRVDDRVVAAVMIARGRPPAAVARELAPWLAVGLAVLLAGGTAIASLAVFRPAQARLSDLEQAARRFGAGDLTARAVERGGDEVAAVARAFNRMADDAAAREAALVEADRARRQLLADVTHELRTPLTAIRGYAETLTLPAFAPPSPEGQRFVHIVDVEAQRLERLVNDLLDLARVDAGGATFERAPVPVAALFTRIVERHGPTAAAAAVTLETSVAGGLDTVPGDARRLEQVVQNLTANAIRHTPAGGRVAWQAFVEGDHVVLRVSDTGEGIGPEHLPHVFDRFYKADPARADGTGTGLGLSIVKAIVERHGGRVGVTSTRGAGTTFDVRLPR
jgi:two-component system, OmpR family, sensor kinase